MQHSNTHTSFTWPDEFINNDMRFKKKTQWQSYEISNEFFQLRHSITLPIEKLNNARVLDLGSYLGTTGYWALSHNCREYVGVELISEYAKQSREFLNNYYQSRWSITEQSIQDYITTTTEQFDIIVAWGVFNTFTDPIVMLEKLLSMGDYIVIDSPIPLHIINTQTSEENVAIIELNPHSAMMQAQADTPITFFGSRISLRAIELIAGHHGFELITDPYKQLQLKIPNTYGQHSESLRSMAVLQRNSTIEKSKSYLEIYG